MTSFVEAEATELKIANKVDNAIAGLLNGVPPKAHIPLVEARAAILRATEALANAAESPDCG